MPMVVAILGLENYNDGVGLLLHKRKYGAAQWILWYTIHGCCREIGLGVLNMFR
ncbi:hypothetical protein GGR08_001373 [Bartonella fuyuanensis]|uniref:Uncharacterized protein n=1 Tax=Bartonella fuyuanensis TaxID=1460968 RepID=A0A840E254_9HYPH|nr:hypothetical protein [Bartonella fuyuanensis]